MKIKNRTVTAIILGVLFAALVAVYFIFVNPLLGENDDGRVELDLLDGEVLITDRLTNFYIFQPIPRSEIRTIEVENEHGTFSVKQDKKSASGFSLEGITALPLDDNKLASLVVTTGTPVAMMRAAENLGDDREKLAEFGLDEPQAQWTLTKTNGDKITMYVGDGLITEGGYYVKLADRDAVYIMSLTLADTILEPGYNLLSPKLIDGLTENNYYLLDSFVLVKGDDVFVAVERMTETEILQNQMLVLRMAYPHPENNTSENTYALNEDLYFDVMYSFVNQVGDRVVALRPTEEDLAQYGLDEPYYTIVLTSGGVEMDIFVSARQENGKYYAVSSMYGYMMICEMPAESLAWLEYDFFKWIEEMPFYVDIKTVSRLSVKGGEVDVDFTLKHSTDENGNALLEVKEENSGKKFTGDDVANFRKYYMTLMNITNQEYATLSEEDKAALTENDDNLVMTMTYENTAGQIYEYKFYRYFEASTGHVSGGKYFTTVNGVGEFYTSNDLVEKALSDADRVMDGLDIDSYGHR